MTWTKARMQELFGLQVNQHALRVYATKVVQSVTK
jgi:hypothetical protein